MTPPDNLAAPVGPPASRTLPTNLLCGLLQDARLLGINPDPWFAGLRLGLAEVQSPEARISYRQASEVIRRALRTLPADIGLTLGSRQNGGNFGLIGLAMKTSRDFGQAVAIGLEYQRNQGPMLELRLEPGTSDGPLVIAAVAPEGQDDLLPFLCEEMFASLLMLGRELAGPDFGPVRVELAYDAPAYRDRYTALFGCEVVFKQARNALVVDKRWLALQFPSYNPVTSQFALTMCRAQLAAAGPEGEYTVAVERSLRKLLGENPQMETIATQLHLSERSLRRHLSDEDTSFSAIHDRIRAERALELLGNPAHSIAHVGSQVGFHDVREFRRAFKRWTGSTPSEARDRLR